jgi:hypothetical protein
VENGGSVARQFAIPIPAHTGGSLPRPGNLFLGVLYSGLGQDGVEWTGVHGQF